MFGLLRRIRQINKLGDRATAEPFAGGAGASLSLLFQEETPDIAINDADPAIHGFWWSLINKPRQLEDMVRGANVTMAEWYRQRDIYRSSRRVSHLRRGFAAFYLNRCNRSGIIVNGGPIGGIEQKGEWKLGARFNRSELAERCARVSVYKDRISVSDLDGIEFVRNRDTNRTFLFVDPPYFVKGPTLYLNSLNNDYHERLADTLKGLSNAAWVLTYDDCAEVRRLYKGWTTIKPFSLRYNAAERRYGKEVLIVPRWMNLPSGQDSEAILW